LDREAAKAIVTDLKNQKSQSETVDEGPVIPLLLQNKPPVNEDTQEAGELADLHMRPEPSTDEDYAEMPISEFGKAMLRGMGWNEGKAIGKTNKGMVAPVEFIPRMGKLGLGAAPKPQAMPDKKRPRKPGETDKKVQGPYIGADGRVKHTRLIGEELPEQPIEGFSPGNFARVLSGAHLGLCGKIVSADEDNSRVCLRLAINGQTIDFSQHRLELISKDEYRKPPAKPSNTKEYGLIKKGVRDQSSPTSQGLSGSEPSTSKILEQPSSDDTSRGSRDKKRHAEHVDLNFENAKRSKRSKDMHRSQRDSPSAASLSEGNSHHHKRSSRERLWVAPSLRVRIIDTKFKGGKYYNSKVTILDVVSGDQCVCQTAEGRHLEGSPFLILTCVGAGV
jgi:G patch domain/KOW motif-containing protein